MTDDTNKKNLNALEQAIDKKIDKAIDDLSEIISTLAQSMHNELQGIRSEITDVRKSINQLTNTIDGFVKRLEDQELENKARDHEVARLTRWVEQIAKKTGVQLK